MEEFRKYALKNPIELNAEKTIAAIKDANNGIAEILKVAMTELDPTVIVQRITDSKNSNFNLDALIALKDLGIDTDIYPYLGGSAYKIQFKREQVRQEAVRVEIDQLSLQMVFGVGYVASYTMSLVYSVCNALIPDHGHHTIWSLSLTVG